MNLDTAQVEHPVHGSIEVINSIKSNLLKPNAIKRKRSGGGGVGKEMFSRAVVEDKLKSGGGYKRLKAVNCHTFINLNNIFLLNHV